MQYFINTKSCADLKQQYYTLAMQHHPDRGGDIKIMQAVNAEYDILFALWRKADAAETAHTGQQSRREFYTENGWKGNKYDSSLRTTDIAKILRTYLKEAHPECKFSVTQKDGRAICISLVAAPWEAFAPGASPDVLRRQYQQTGHSHGYTSNSYTQHANSVMLDAVDFVNQYRRDDSDSMIDYFDTNFYIHTAIGKWDRSFVVEERRARRSNKVKAAA